MSFVAASRRHRAPASIEELEHELSTPTRGVAEDLAAVDGDILVIGAGGKIGPTLARMARRALDEIGSASRVIGVSRFSDAAERRRLDAVGVETVAADLLDDALDELPDAPNVLFLLGRKFGTDGAEPLTWALNGYVPARVARRFAGSRIVAFSTGNVYPQTAVVLGGPTEGHALGPVGEYAQSCLARERLLADASERLGTSVLLFRLNYAVELRYGVLVDIACAVHAGKPVDVTSGSVNVIWQQDANAYALRALTLAASPATALNVSGPETVSTRWLAERFAERFGVEPVIEGSESSTALLTNAARAHALFGYPTKPLLEIVDWTAEWVGAGMPTHGKPTHFQQREGVF